MPQRKDYDVYSGNQKIGEIWSNHPVKSDYETDLNIQIETVDHYFKKKAAWEIKNSSEYKSKESKMQKFYIIRVIIGIVLIAVSLLKAVMNVINHAEMESLFSTFVLPAIIFGLGAGMICTFITTSTKKEKPVICWPGALGAFALGGIIFLVVDFLVSFAVVRFVL